MGYNTLVTPVEVTDESLRIWENSCVLIRRIDKQYSKEFGIEGGKVGRTINIRLPDRGPVRKGQVLDSKPITDKYVPLQLTCQWGTDISFATAELSTSVDRISDRYLKPRIAILGAQMDSDIAQGVVTGTFTGSDGLTPSLNPIFNAVGTPGTTPGTSGGTATGIAQYNVPIVYLNAGMMMHFFSTPPDAERYSILDPAAHALSSNAQTNLFNPSSNISEIYKKGHLGEGQGFKYALDQNVYKLTLGARTGSFTLQAALTNNSATVHLQTGTGTIVAGDRFTIAGVYSVNPVNMKPTNQLQQFVVTAAITAAGTNDSVSVYPTPRIGYGLNDDTVWTATGDFTGSSTGGGASSPVTFLGTASTVATCNLAFHRDFATFATCELEMPDNVWGARRDWNGVTMRVVRQYNIGTDQIPLRVDLLGGATTCHPEWSSIIMG